MGRVIVIVARLSKLRVKIGGDDDGSVTACVSWGADENDVDDVFRYKLTCSPYSGMFSFKSNFIVEVNFQTIVHVGNNGDKLRDIILCYVLKQRLWFDSNLIYFILFYLVILNKKNNNILSSELEVATVPEEKTTNGR